MTIKLESKNMNRNELWGWGMNKFISNSDLIGSLEKFEWIKNLIDEGWIVKIVWNYISEVDHYIVSYGAKATLEDYFEKFKESGTTTYYVVKLCNTTKRHYLIRRLMPFLEGRDSYTLGELGYKTYYLFRTDLVRELNMD